MERKYEEAVALLPEDKQQAVRAYCDAIFDSGAEAEHLPYESGKFDLLTCTDSFHHYPNPQIAIEEFYRVLKTDGHLILADFWKPFPVRQLMNIFIPFGNEGDVRVYSQKEITYFLVHSGFQNIEYQKINNSSYLAVAKK